MDYRKYTQDLVDYYGNKANAARACNISYTTFLRMYKCSDVKPAIHNHNNLLLKWLKLQENGNVIY